MNLEKVVFGFVIVLAATLNFGFFIGDIDNPVHHEVWGLFAAIAINLIATILKFGRQTVRETALYASRVGCPRADRPRLPSLKTATIVPRVEVRPTCCQ